jgi:type I restriction enzyme M protein
LLSVVKIRGFMWALSLDFMFEQAFKNIDDVLWKDAGCTSELDYTEQTSWLLFLKYLDALERDKGRGRAEGKKIHPHPR